MSDENLVLHAICEHYADAANRVRILIGGGESAAIKASKWMTEPNPLLGGVSPVDMICGGRYSRLDKFICEAEAIAAAVAGFSPTLIDSRPTQ